MQGENGGEFGLFVRESGLGNEEISRDARVGLGSVADLASHVIAAIHFLLNLYVERDALLLPRHGTHDLLHSGEDLGAPLLPVGDGLDGQDGAVRMSVAEEVGAGEAFGGGGEGRGSEDCNGEREFHLKATFVTGV